MSQEATTSSPSTAIERVKTPTMLWLRAAAVFFVIVGGHGQTTVFCRNAREVMNGLLPRHSDVLKQPNPAIRGAIFDLNPTSAPDPDETRSRPFVYEMEENTYLPQTAFHTIRSYEEYRKLAGSSISFETADDDSTIYGSLEPNFKEQEEELAIKRKFEDNNVEAAFVTLDCLTHIVSIDRLVMPSFTPAFVSNLDALDEAAKEPNSASSKTTLESFFRTFGTHFARTTHLGSQLLFGILFPSRAADAREDAARIQCVLDSAVETLILGAQNANDSTTLRFSRIAADKCRVEEIRPLVGVIGPLPGSSFDGWALEAIKNPRPIRYFAEKISSFFKTNWIANVLKKHEAGTKLLNGSALCDFFCRAEMKMASDQEGQPPAERTCGCPSGDVGLGVSSGTQDSEECTKSPAEYGGVVIIGGVPLDLLPSETLGIPELPSFPSGEYGNTVSIVDSTVFNCGGMRKEQRKTCDYLRAGEPTWRSIALPWEIFGHNAVTVHDTIIWFQKVDKLYSYDTAKDNDQFRKYSLSINLRNTECMVTNQSHTFIIGDGYGKIDVWVNRDPSKPTEWEKVAHLFSRRESYACLWFGSDIFLTGGMLGGVDLDSVVVLNLVDMTFRSTTRALVDGRHGHEMAVLHGKPAVLGGKVGSEDAASIEVYECITETWQTLNYTMKAGRYLFGLAQYRP